MTLKLSYKELKNLLDASPFFYATNKKNNNHKYKAFDVTRSANYWIKELLLEYGYWKFAPSRSDKIVYYHQVVAFFFVSKNKKLDGNGSLLFIHHISGNTLDNSPNNLVYLTKEDHEIVTRFQRKACTFKLSSFFKLKEKAQGARTFINRKGELVKNWARFILGVIALTLAETYSFSGFKFVSPPSLIVSVVAFARRFVTRFFNNVNASFTNLLLL